MIAVTGGTGRIGRIVVNDLLAAGYRVRLLARSPPDYDDVEQVPVDLADDEPVPPGALSGCSGLVHLAAYIPPDQADPSCAELCFRINALGTIELLRRAEEEGVKAVVQTTSANAYAPGKEQPDEDDPMFPSGRAPFYLSSKLAQDIIGAHWSARRGLPVTTLRISSVYGVGLEETLFARFAKCLLAGDAIELAGDGAFGADFVDVSDVSAAILLFLGRGAGETFNIASGVRTTLLDAAGILLRLTGSEQRQLIVRSGGDGDPGFPAINVNKAKQAGFEPTDLETGLARVVDWQRKLRLRPGS